MDANAATAKPEFNYNGMLKRLLSTLTLWTLTLSIPYLFGPSGAVWILALLTVLTQYELYTLLEKIDFRPQKRLGCLFGALIILGAWYLPAQTELKSIYVSSDLFTLSVITVCLTMLIRPDFTETKDNIMPTLLGLLLVPYMLAFYVRLFHHFGRLGQPEVGLLMAVWLIAVAKFTDVGGLLIGKVFGRHKLAKEISPGKTWEGAIGGIAVGCGIGAWLASLFANYYPMPEKFTPALAAIIGIPIAIISITSDLIESVLKRKAGVKDSGSMIPGIGGAFDLTDSLLLSAPCGFLILVYTVF